MQHLQLADGMESRFGRYLKKTGGKLGKLAVQYGPDALTFIPGVGTGVGITSKLLKSKAGQRALKFAASKGGKLAIRGIKGGAKAIKGLKARRMQGMPEAEEVGLTPMPLITGRPTLPNEEVTDTQTYYPSAQIGPKPSGMGGMSTTTMLAIGGAIAAAVLLSKRK
jgi:hypothetical protein